MRNTLLITSSALLLGETWYIGQHNGFSSQLMMPLFASMVGAVLAIPSSVIPSAKAGAAIGWTACALLCGSGLALLVVGAKGAIPVALISVFADSAKRDQLALFYLLPLFGCGSLICGLILQRQLRRQRLAARSVNESP